MNGFKRWYRGSFLPLTYDTIAVSDLVHCHTCPVRFYFEKDVQRSESDRYAICKQISYHLGTSLDPAAIWDEVLAVRPSVSPPGKEFFGHCISACAAHAWKPAIQNDVKVVSGQFGLVGMVDRLFSDGGFAIIRATGSLLFGISGSDRLRVAACALCLEEMTGKPVPGGHIEHIPDGISRFHEVRPRDRRQLVATVRKVQAIRGGEVPARPLNAPCGRCQYRERCEESGGRRLSELL